ncbi:MAG: hypothetical protein ABI346_09975 [Candidatus Baltobacteraceae bacterium]
MISVAAELAAFDALVAKYAEVRSYVVEITGRERSGEGFVERGLRFSFRKPDRAETVVLSGSSVGTRVVWKGGSRVTVRVRPIAFVPLSLDLHDKRVVSPRGNTMLAADLGRVLRCFQAHRADVLERRAKPSGNTAIVLERKGGVACADDPPADRGVTRDVLVLGHDGWPVRRERFAGAQLVESWTLDNLRTNVDLPDADFR